MASMEEPTAAIVQAFKQGRDLKENFDRLWYRYYARVYRYFQGQKLAPDKCKELTQEVFLAVYKGLKGIQNEEKFEIWLLTIAANRYKTYQRECQKRRHIVPFDPEVHADPVEPGRSPEDAVLDEEKIRAFETAWQALPDQQRDCLRLYHYEDRSYKEIAEIKGIGVETVKSHLKQGRKTLRQHLGTEFVNDWNEDV